MNDRQANKIYEFDAKLLKHENIDATFIEFPYDVEKEFGIRGQVKVRGTFDGVEYRGSLARMGHHCHCLGVTQEVRRRLNKHPGSTVHVVLQKDDAPREIKIPEDINKLLLLHDDIAILFNSLSYTHKKEYVRWIVDAKKAETRQRRLNKMLEMLRNKSKHP